MAKRLKPGDVLEITTSKGLAYVQVSHIHKDYGHLVRVLPGFFASRPESFKGSVTQQGQFATFFPAQAAVSQGIVAFVAHEEVPEHARIFPVFRARGGIASGTNKVLNWWLWDGEKAWRVKELAREQWALPIGEILNDTMLIRLIEEGWTPEKDRPSEA